MNYAHLAAGVLCLSGFLYWWIVTHKDYPKHAALKKAAELSANPVRGTVYMRTENIDKSIGAGSRVAIASIASGHQLACVPTLKGRRSCALQASRAGVTFMHYVELVLKEEPLAAFCVLDLDLFPKQIYHVCTQPAPSLHVFTMVITDNKAQVCVDAAFSDLALERKSDCDCLKADNVWQECKKKGCNVDKDRTQWNVESSLETKCAIP